MSPVSLGKFLFSIEPGGACRVVDCGGDLLAKIMPKWLTSVPAHRQRGIHTDPDCAVGLNPCQRDGCCMMPRGGLGLAVPECVMGLTIWVSVSWLPGL